MTPQSLGPLGELERAVMEYLWGAGPADVKGVHRAIGTGRSITVNTVQSTMERLYRKGLLRREKVSHAFVYTAALARKEYGMTLVQEVVRNVLGSETEPMLSAFVDIAARTGDSALARLEEMLAQRRRSQASRGTVVDRRSKR